MNPFKVSWEIVEASLRSTGAPLAWPFADQLYHHMISRSWIKFPKHFLEWSENKKESGRPLYVFIDKEVLEFGLKEMHMPLPNFAINTLYEVMREFSKEFYDQPKAMG